MVKGTVRVDSGFTGHGNCLSLYPIKINLSPSLYIQRREVNLWKYSRVGKNYRVDKAVTS
jgi:hypothetical protein